MPTWSQRIQAALKEEDQWRRDARTATETYRKKDNRSGFNILWPNTVLKQAAVFARVPKPVVRTRFGTDPTTQKISLMLERALEYQMDIQPYQSIMDCVVLDWLLPGRGVSRVRYHPQYMEQEEPVFTDDSGNYYTDSLVQVLPNEIVIRDDEVFRKVDEVVAEEARIDHCGWAHFTHDPQERWEDVEWIAFYHKITRADAIKAFGKRASERMAVAGMDDNRRMDSGAKDLVSTDVEPRLACWEVWDRQKGEVRYVSEGVGKESESTLEKYDDPYNLKNFYPIARPLIAVQTPGTTMPTCEYSLYEEQARELNTVTTQLKRLLKQVRVKIAYDAAMPESIRNLARTDDNVMVPVEGWMSFMQQGGLDAALQYMPFDKAAAAAAVLSQYREQLIGTIHEISGLSDIMRGSSDARETATAQQIKSQFGGLRLKPLQTQLQLHIVETMELQSELMAEKFDIDTLAAISKIDPPPLTETIIRGDTTRQFTIDIESDSTLAMDDAQQKQERQEFLVALTDVMTRAAAAKDAGLVNQKAIGEIIKFAIAPYRVSRELEDALEEFGQEEQQQQADPQAQAQMMQAQIQAQELQLKAQGMQQDAQLDAAKLQLEGAKAEHGARMDQEKLLLEAFKVGVGA